MLMRDGIEFKERKNIIDISTEYKLEIGTLQDHNMNLLVIVLYWPEKYRNTELFFSSLD